MREGGGKKRGGDNGGTQGVFTRGDLLRGRRLGGRVQTFLVEMGGCRRSMETGMV